MLVILKKRERISIQRLMHLVQTHEEFKGVLLGKIGFTINNDRLVIEITEKCDQAGLDPYIRGHSKSTGKHQVSMSANDIPGDFMMNVDYVAQRARFEYRSTNHSGQVYLEFDDRGFITLFYE